MEKLQQNPEDYAVIQIATENAVSVAHNVDLQRTNDRYAAKMAEIQHLQQKEIDLTNNINNLDIENTSLHKWTISPEK